nr:hypothetical protein L204_04906 [Cryptococcus depauperatus CBS 7855]
MAPRREDVENLTTIIYTNDGEVVWHGAEFGINETMAVNRYQISANISSSFAGSGIDFREVLLTTNKTVLVTIYVNEQCDLSSMGVTTTDGSNGWILDDAFEEIDVVIDEQFVSTRDSIDHINPIGCYNEPGSTDISEFNPWIYFHINSIEKSFEGNYLISSRYCHALYLIAASTGEILWTIGSKNSSFAMGDGASFYWQHDARWRNNYTQTYSPWNRTVSKSQGSIQQQSNSNYLVGWGQMPFVSEYASDDTLISSVQFGAGNVQGYRILRQRWTAYPATKPIIFVIHNSNNDQYEVYTSWNRATEIDQ